MSAWLQERLRNVSNVTGAFADGLSRCLLNSCDQLRAVTTNAKTYIDAMLAQNLTDRHMLLKAAEVLAVSYADLQAGDMYDVSCDAIQPIMQMYMDTSIVR